MTATDPPLVERPVFFLDYDGTLAPIVERPFEAYPHPDIPPILIALKKEHPVWIVTGRDIESLAQLCSVPLPVIGIHGLQRGRIGGEIELLVNPQLRSMLDDLRETVPAIEGLWVEEKGPTFAVHYRDVSDQAAAERALRRWADLSPAAVEVLWGKKVAELRPKGFSKGHAVKDVMVQWPQGTPVYLGDDTTDEDAFRMLAAPAVTVKIGPGETAARYRLADVDAVAAYLKEYV